MKIIVQIATIPSRADLLPQVLASLTNQCSEINVFLNGHKEPPKLNFKNVNYYLLDNSLGDAAKFLFIEHQAPEAYILTCDDDLIYPDGYVHEMIKACQRLNTPVTHHGSIFIKLPVQNYYQDKKIKFHCLAKNEIEGPVQIAGTGVLCFKASMVKGLSVAFFHKPNMADIFFSKFCYQRGIRINVLKHPDDYLKYLTPKETIYENYYNACEYQTKLVNSFLS